MVMRITEASRRLGISPRMLRYRESLGLLPVVRARSGARRLPLPPDGSASQPGRLAPARSGPGRGRPGAARRPVHHRQFGAADLDAVALGLAIEQRYDVNPAALAFGLRVLADPAARAEVAELGRRIGRIRPLPAMALDFEKERALRMLGNPAGGQAATRRPAARRPADT